MKQKLALLLAGLLVGGLLMSVVPASGQTPTAFRRLKNKVERLEKRLNRLQRMVNNRTQQMNRNGFYLGIIGGDQVLSFCPDETTAMWEESPFFIGEDVLTWLDICLEAMPTSARHVPTERQLQRMLGR